MSEPTLRQRYAGQMMAAALSADIAAYQQGLVGNPTTAWMLQEYARDAVAAADALIAALEKPVSKTDENGIDADYEAAMADRDQAEANEADATHEADWYNLNCE